MSQADKRANLKIASRRQSLSTSTLNPEAFRGFPHCIIRYNLSGVVNRRMIGDDKMKLATFFDFDFPCK